jgi:hypothetical protein
MDGAVMARLKANPPPNAEAFFLGDTLGGNGWVVRMPDGSTEHVYVELPEDVDIESRLELVDAPAEHDGSPIPDASVETVGRVYFDALSGMVREAVERFGH